MSHKILFSLLVISLPAMAHAQIYSRTTASSDSGGNAAGPGGKVETGSASASVTASSISGSSSSSIYIKTNGHEESYSSGSSDVGVSVQATPKETVIETREGSAVKRTVIPSASAPLQASAEPAGPAAAVAEIMPAAARAQSPGLGAAIVLSIRNFFAGLLGWLI
jgi:hypothetical protein